MKMTIAHVMIFFNIVITSQHEQLRPAAAAALSIAQGQLQTNGHQPRKPPYGTGRARTPATRRCRSESRYCCRITADPDRSAANGSDLARSPRHRTGTGAGG